MQTFIIEGKNLDSTVSYKATISTLPDLEGRQSRKKSTLLFEGAQKKMDGFHM